MSSRQLEDPSWRLQADVVDRFLIGMAGRRALRYETMSEDERWFTKAVLDVRQEAVQALKELGRNAGVAGRLRDIEAACREYLDEQQRSGWRLSRRAVNHWRYRLRAAMAELGEAYRVPLEHRPLVEFDFGGVSMYIPDPDMAPSCCPECGWPAVTTDYGVVTLFVSRQPTQRHLSERAYDVIHAALAAWAHPDSFSPKHLLLGLFASRECDQILHSVGLTREVVRAALFGEPDPWWAEDASPATFDTPSHEALQRAWSHGWGEGREAMEPRDLLRSLIADSRLFDPWPVARDALAEELLSL